MKVQLLSDNQILFKLSAPLLRLMILNLLATNSSYGYEITNTLRTIYPMNESSVYIALKELSEKEFVTCQFKIIAGKLRAKLQQILKHVMQIFLDSIIRIAMLLKIFIEKQQAV